MTHQPGVAMGIYDRDYYQEPQRGIALGGDRSMVVNLILINVGVFLVDFLFEGRLAEYFGLRSDLLQHPWQAYQLLTYGFLHDPNNLMHVVFNMLGLWFFGREVEFKYGRTEFLVLYLSLIVLSGLFWLIIESMASAGSFAVLVGASGAIVGVLLLFALNFPHRTVLIWFVLPVPAWVLAVLLVVGDLMGATSRSMAGNVAYTCHLSGAAMAFMYYISGVRLTALAAGSFSLRRLPRSPRLKIHDPEKRDRDLQQQVDDILRKIQQEGQESLTRAEKRTLEEASRRYQQKHR